MKLNGSILCALILVVTISGCGVFSPQLLNAVSDHRVPPVEALHIAPHLFSPDGEFSSIDVSKLMPGQKVQILPGTPPGKKEHWVDTGDIIAGVVHEISETHLVLSDVVKVTYGVSHDTGTMLSRVPYVSRLFRNTAIGIATTHVPGTVTLPRAEVRASSVLTDEAYRSLSNGKRPRIGVDFDVVEDTHVQ